MSGERKKGSAWPWIAALMIALPVLYIGLFGPACWLTATRRSTLTPAHPLMMVYLPFGKILGSDDTDKWPGRILHRWATLRIVKGYAATVPIDWNGRRVWLFAPHK